MRRDTKKFIELLEQQNAMIAENALIGDRKSEEAVSPDEIRLKREEERRDKYGRLRARDSTPQSDTARN